MKPSVLPINEKVNNKDDFTENKSGILSDELIDAISSIPQSEVILYQKVDQFRNIIPFHRNYKEGWEALTIAQMLQLNCLKKIKQGKYSKDTFTIEVHNMDEGKLYHWQSDFTNLKFEVENIGGDDNED
jgi:hypothetical protein